MGFYLRKSFRAGPVRINLSKSGLGLSAGVKGARIGVTSRGRTYVHAGRGGLYMREYIGSGGRGGSAASVRGARQQLGYTEPIVIDEETGVTYSSKQISSAKLPLRSRLKREKPAAGKFLLIPLLALFIGWMAASLGDGDAALKFVGMTVACALLLVWPVPMLLIWQRNQRGRRLGVHLHTKLKEPRSLSAGEIEELRGLLCDQRVSESDRVYFCRREYLGLLRNIVEDGQVSDKELSALKQIEEVFELEPDFINGARVDTYREVYLEAVGDHELTAEEENTLDHIRKRLEISEGDLSEELEVQRSLGEVRHIRAGEVPIVNPSKSLSKGETCHFEGVGRILKLRNLETFQREGLKYKVQGFVIDKEGTLLLTSKRILLIHQGTSSIPLNKIVDLEIDYDRNLLTIIKDGVKNPVYITTPNALKAAAIVAVNSGL